jgi:DNA/RNA-binding domain of Phe-tRNA-synthetase-like protein
LTDLYNAISVSHRIPVGGEDLTRYAGVTCRRWNWRQARRTQLADDTSAALFILDALDPVTDAALAAAADELSAHLSLLGPDVRVARRLLGESIRP